MQLPWVWIAMAVMVSTRLWLGGEISPRRDKALIEALVGRIRAIALCRPILVAVGYDESGQVLAQRQATLDVTLLKAGAITPFTLDLTVSRGVVADYKVLVQGLKVE
jgi:hypothetical protein